MLLSQVAERIDRIENKRKQSNLAACVELLAGINYSEKLIAMYLQEDILKESVIYKKIINEGIQQGEQRGESSLIIRPRIIDFYKGKLPWMIALTVRFDDLT